VIKTIRALFPTRQRRNDPNRKQSSRDVPLIRYSSLYRRKAINVSLSIFQYGDHKAILIFSIVTHRNLPARGSWKLFKSTKALFIKGTAFEIAFSEKRGVFIFIFFVFRSLRKQFTTLGRVKVSRKIKSLKIRQIILSENCTPPGRRRRWRRRWWGGGYIRYGLISARIYIFLPLFSTPGDSTLEGGREQKQNTSEPAGE